MTASLDDFEVGQRLDLTYPDGDPLTGTVIALEPACEILTSRGVVVEPQVVVEWDNGDVTGERPEDLADPPRQPPMWPGIA